MSCEPPCSLGVTAHRRNTSDNGLRKQQATNKHTIHVSCHLVMANNSQREPILPQESGCGPSTVDFDRANQQHIGHATQNHKHSIRQLLSYPAPMRPRESPHGSQANLPKPQHGKGTNIQLGHRRPPVHSIRRQRIHCRLDAPFLSSCCSKNMRADHQQPRQLNTAPHAKLHRASDRSTHTHWPKKQNLDSPNATTSKKNCAGSVEHSATRGPSKPLSPSPLFS